MKKICLARIDTETDELLEYYEICHSIPECDEQALLIKAQADEVRKLANNEDELRLVIASLNTDMNKIRYSTKETVDKIRYEANLRYEANQL